MNKIKSRHIGILIVLLAAFLRPSLGQGQNVSGSNIVSRTMLSSDCTASVNQRVYDKSKAEYE